MHPLLPFVLALALAWLVLFFAAPRHTRILKWFAALLILASFALYVWRIAAFFPHTVPMEFNSESLLGRMN